MAKKIIIYSLLVIAVLGAKPAQAVMNGQGQDVVPVPAVFQSSATVYYSNSDNAGVTVSSGLVVSAGSVIFGGTSALVLGGPAAQDVGNNGAILANGIYKKISSSEAGNATLANSPSIVPGVDGQVMIIVNVDATDSVIINNNTGVIIQGTTLTLAPTKLGLFIFTGTNWILISTTGIVA